jgi:hypothetical protein
VYILKTDEIILQRVSLGPAAFVINPNLTFLVCSQHTGWEIHRAAIKGSPAQHNRNDFLFTNIPSTQGSYGLGDQGVAHWAP